MENGHKIGSSWENTAALSKFNAFTSALKLRGLRLSPKELLKNLTKFDDLSLIVNSSNEFVLENSNEIFEWIRQEIHESGALLQMADGFVVDGGSDEKIEFKNDVYTFSSRNSLNCAEERLKFALDAMKIFVDCDVFRPKAAKMWRDSLNFAKKIDKTGLAEELLSKFDAENDENQSNSKISFKKFQENDDLYVLQNGLNGYVEALDKILRKIGGREWDMQVLEVLERKAAMIVEFQQIRYLVDVLPAVQSMVDMRIQQSLNRIFKTAFANLPFGVKKQVLNYYYQKYQSKSVAEMDKDYGTELNLIINSLSVGDHKKNTGKYRSIAVRLAWHFMLSAKHCWWIIAKAIINTPALINPMVDVLRHLAPVVSLRLPENNNRLVLEGWSRLVEQNLLTNEDQEGSWTDFLLHLCNGAPKKPVVEATEIVRSFLMPMLTIRPSLTLECLCKIFDDPTTKIVWNAEFSNGQVSASDEHVDATRLFAAVFDIFVRASKKGHSETPTNLEVRKLCPKTLISMVKRWSMEDVQLSLDGYQWLKSSFDALPWVQQVFAFWLLRDCCVKDDVIVAPECLCDLLSLPESKYTPIDCPSAKDHSKIDCALSSMMEAACFSTEMGLMFIVDGNFQKLNSSAQATDLRPKLLRSAKVTLEGRALNEWKNVVKWLDVFFDRLDMKEVGKDSFCAKELTEFLAGCLLVAPVMILSDVAVLMLKEDTREGEEIVKLWMQNFYSIARDCQSSVGDKLEGQLAKETALRRLWYACTALVKCFKNTPKQLEWLLSGLHEAYRRCNVQFHRDMLEDVAPHISTEVAETMFKKMDQACRVDVSDAQVCVDKSIDV